MVRCVRLHLMLSANALGMLVKSAYKNWKKAKEDKFDMFIKLCKNEGNLDVRNMLSDSRKKIIDQSKTRLRHVIKFVEFCGRQERISKKQDSRLVGRIPSFRGEYSQLFFYKLRAFLDYSYHKQFFLFKAFACITSAPHLEKSWLRPCSQPMAAFFQPDVKVLDFLHLSRNRYLYLRSRASEVGMLH